MKKVHYSFAYSVLSKFVMIVRKTEWFLPDQYFSVSRQNARKYGKLSVSSHIFLIRKYIGHKRTIFFAERRS